MPMKALTHHEASGTFTQRVQIRSHELIIDEPPEHGGEDRGPNPQELLAASLATCTAITIQMYARRKEWELPSIEVACEYESPERDRPTTFTLVLRLPAALNDEQVERLTRIAAKCPVHRILEGEVAFEQRVELVGQSTT